MNGWHIVASIATRVIACFCFQTTRGVIIKRDFNGKIEKKNAHVRLTVIKIEELLHDFPNEFGEKQQKMRQEEDDPNPLRKLSILYKLDPMHIEKNLFHNVVGTLLAIPGKLKDHIAVS